MAGKELLMLKGHTRLVRSVTFSPDGKTLASGGFDGNVKLWDVTTGKELASLLQGPTDPVYCVAFSPDGKILASGSRDPEAAANTTNSATIKLWDVSTGQERATFKGHTDCVHSVTFSPNGKTLASGSWDKTIKLWDVATGKERATFEGHPDGVRSVAFSPDGRTLASGSEDVTVKLWDMATGKERATLKGHTGNVYSVAYSRDGKTLASGSLDGTVKLWDVTTGKERATFKDHVKEVYCVAFSPDGKTFASGSTDTRVFLRDLTGLSKDFAGPGQEKTPSAKWEHKAVSFGSDEKENTKRLNDLAADGWEYVGSLGNTMVAFKRSLINIDPLAAAKELANWQGTWRSVEAGVLLTIDEDKWTWADLQGKPVDGGTIRILGVHEKIIKADLIHETGDYRGRLPRWRSSALTETPCSTTERPTVAQRRSALDGRGSRSKS